MGHVIPKTTKAKIDDVLPADYNPRKIKDAELKRLIESIKAFGFVEPVVVNTRTGVIVGGHQRVAAAKELGYTHVPVVEVDLDEARERALNLALNKISGEWDGPKLADVIGELRGMADEEVLALTGFSDEEQVKLLAKFGAPEDFPEVDANLDTTYRCPQCQYEWSGSPKPGEGGGDDS